jgi:hypothetical protein
MTPIAALWVALTFIVPAINASGVPQVIARLVVYVLIGLWLGLERAKLTASERSATWLAVVWSAAINGFFNAAGSVPPVLFARFIPVVIAAPILLWSRRIGQVARRDPPELAHPASGRALAGRPVSLRLGPPRAARHLRAAGRHRRCADRPLCRAGRSLAGARQPGKPPRGDRLACLWPLGFLVLDSDLDRDLAAPDRDCLRQRGERRLSGGDDPGVWRPAGNPAALVRQLVRRNRAAIR